MSGRLSWVGYCHTDVDINELPPLRKGVFTPLDSFSSSPDKISARLAERLNIQYAKNYKVENDIIILFSKFLKIGEISFL